MATQLRQDFLLDSDGDFPLEDTIVNGVYLPTPYGNSDNQHKIDIIFFNTGSLKQYPTEGFGIFKYENSEYDADNVYSNLSQEVKDDGYKLMSGSIYPVSEGGFDINTDLITNNY